MEKMSMETKDLTQENIIELTKLFPELITEVERDGDVVKTVNVETLKNLVGDFADGSDEFYELNWVGKSESRQKIVTPINKTLRPVPEDSVDFENTENLYIEGDNFEVLKLLQESYLNKVKMIYIDPPYNTGKDFVYKDNFSMSREEYDEETRAIDEEGNKLFRNITTNGRFHSDWLSMMFERLVIAKDLLRDDGAIYISIDDNEVHNLRLVMNEVFGEENFVANFPRVTKKAGKTTDTIAKNNDYVLCYQKTDNFKLNSYSYTDEGYKNCDEFEEIRGKYKLSQTLDYGSIQYSPSLDYEIEINGMVLRPGNVARKEMDERKKRNPSSDFCWRWSKDLYQFGLKNGFIVLKESKNGFRIYTKTYEKATISKNNRDYFVEIKQRTKSATTLDFIENEYSNDNSRKDIGKVFNGKVFEYSKPISLIKTLSFLSSNDSDIILDFFSGSATTAHAVMQLNAEDGGNRRFIMLQLPEPTAEDSDAFKAGYKNIAEIGRDRIKRAARKIQEDNTDIDLSNIDFGFRVFKLDSSNLKDIYYNPTDIDQRTLTNFRDNIKEDRTDKDLLYQVLLEMAVPISAKIKEEIVNNKTIYRVNDDFLVACFDDDVDLETIKEISEFKPLRFVFKDSSFKDDAAKVNCDEYLKNKLPNTIVKVI